MKIETFKKLKDNKYKIILDNEEELILYDDVIIKYNLLVNKELDNEKLKELVKYNSEMDAYYIALKALNKKMLTKIEIFKLLKKKEFEGNLIDNIIEKLYKENYLNDDCYIKAYINDQINLKLVGPIKIRKDLVELGFDTVEINNYLDNIDGSLWDDKINKFVSKKIKSTSNLSATKFKQKIAIDLVNKGFPKDTVINMISNYEFKTDDQVILKEYNKMLKKLETKYSGSELTYYIKNKLYVKGFSKEEIERVIGE